MPLSRRTALAALLVPILVFVVASRAQTPSGAPVVTLVIDYGQGVEKRYTRLAHTPAMTALDALKAADAMPDPLGLAFEFTGAGETAFVRAIDGLKNEGGAKGDRNWTFKVNGALAKASAGVTHLAPGDELRWSYSPFAADR